MRTKILNKLLITIKKNKKKIQIYHTQRAYFNLVSLVVKKNF